MARGINGYPYDSRTLVPKSYYEEMEEIYEAEQRFLRNHPECDQKEEEEEEEEKELVELRWEEYLDFIYYCMILDDEYYEDNGGEYDDSDFNKFIDNVVSRMIKDGKCDFLTAQNLVEYANLNENEIYNEIEVMRDGQQRGREQINRLNALLIQDERYSDLQKSVKDIDFQYQLMEEYEIL